MAAEPCWHCGYPDGTLLFCGACHVLQPPARDYFELFGIPTRLNLNPADLQKRFYALSRQLHPDRFVRRLPRERDHSVDATAMLNDGYRVLRDPVLRAEYVLRREGFDPCERRSSNVAPELLEEVFELNMAVEEIRHGDESVRPQLEQSRAHFAELLAEVDRKLAGLFAAWDATHERATLEEIRAVLNRRRYIGNLVQTVDAALAAAAPVNA